MPGGGSRNPSSTETIENRLHYLKMNGKEVFKEAVKSMGDASVEAINKAGITSDKIDHFIAHQANFRIMDAVRKRINIPEEKVFMSYNFV